MPRIVLVAALMCCLGFSAFAGPKPGSEQLKLGWFGFLHLPSFDGKTKPVQPLEPEFLSQWRNQPAQYQPDWLPAGASDISRSVLPFHLPAENAAAPVTRRQRSARPR